MYVRTSSEFHKLSFWVLRRKTCCYLYFTKFYIVFALFSVAVSVPTHLCVVCRPFAMFLIRSRFLVNDPTKKAS